MFGGLNFPGLQLHSGRSWLFPAFTEQLPNSYFRTFTEFISETICTTLEFLQEAFLSVNVV
jgi:hypothetical protein